jgi:peptide/nickel transport system permease protein
LTAFLVKRVAQALLVALVATTIAFFLLRLAPGDPFAATLENPSVGVETRQQWRTHFGLDRPVGEQYLRFVAGAARGDLGPSIAQSRPASHVIRDALPHTLLLMGTALTIAFVGGVLLGAWQAVHRNRPAERLTSGFTLLMYSVPELWLALAMMLLFAVHLRWFPVGGAQDALAWLLSPGERLLDRLHHLILPASVLALVHGAAIARFQRDALAEVLTDVHLDAARSRGLSETRVHYRHALRAALAPVTTLLGLAFPALLGGAVLVEQVFAWPGMGYVAINAIAQRDYFVVTGVVVVGGVMAAAGSLIADLLHALVDPRVRES